MVPSLLLLSASLVASPVIVSEVKATREAGHLRVEVRADGGIDPEVARTRIDQGSLFLFLGGTHVKADNRVWKLDQGVGEIRAHRHHTETELDVPLTGNGCTGPVELEGTPTGLTALVGCEGAPAAIPARAVAHAVGAKEKSAPEPAALPPGNATPTAAPAQELTKAAPEPTKAAAPAQAETAALKNLVALPPAEDEDATDEKPTAAKKDDAKVAPVEAPAVKEAAAPVHAETKAAVSEQKAPALELPAPAEPPGKAASLAPSGLRAVGLPALFLAGLALAAYIFARKKRGLGTRRIQILETASLGPKRSLVIARIGDETLVLGSSEAGITLLQTSGDGTAQNKRIGATLAAFTPDLEAAGPTKPAEAEGRSEMDQSLIEALADVPEPDGITPPTTRESFRTIEGGLASLFGRKAAATAAARVEPKFDDILEDSVEDQELRRKLAAGMSARIR